ncbi:MAG: hypothetical protein A2283_07980 [Lentisphaerae bacterium RIFOXYA12_FULL_48_11]|nr:MAG: hypothetical protein A2283_07980 [Lentisphaerae bacterium RIFOXYA12_FULL_48_11]
MLAYQSLLLMGYLYAHGMSKLPGRKQAVIHITLLATSLTLLLIRSTAWATPVLPGIEWTPSPNTSPAWQIIVILIAAIGMPFTILSSTSALLQSWFSRLYPGQAPYVFYTVSNVGSLLALLLYPFIIEPMLPTTIQSNWWTCGYLLFVILCGFCASMIYREKTLIGAPLYPGIQTSTESYVQNFQAPTFMSRIRWLFLSMCSSVILLATTTQITQNVSPVPLLWILPLSLYLLTFAICFRRNSAESNDFWVPAVLFSQCLTLYTMCTNSLGQTIALTTTLFACCMLTHNELYRLKPYPGYLTSFYLMIALGGAIGGVFVGVVAPLIFKGFFEFDFIMLVYSLISIHILSTRRQKWMKFAWVPLSATFLIVIAMFQINAHHERTIAIYRSRNFYGTLSVRKCENRRGIYHELVNGKIKHGIQYQSGLLRKWPTEYFGENSGIGKAFRYHIKKFSSKPIRVGAIGLGIGTIAAYGYSGDYFRFYEINPEVIEVANNTKYFSYLIDSAAKIEVILGDARISMENERLLRTPQAFDMLVVDAFNSDAIPVHLLTREAFELYLYHLAPEALIAIHVSNAYLDLVPVVLSAAKEFHLNHAVMHAHGDRVITESTIWILLTRNRIFTELPAISGSKLPQDKISRKHVLWTDDYSNLFRVMKKP